MTSKTNNQKLLDFDSEQLIKHFKTKSAAIRFLNQEGLTRSQIAAKLEIRYQHVRNVLITPLKKAN